MPLTTAQYTFMRQFYAEAAKICPIYGLKAVEAITAQAMSESGWGKSTLSKKYFNFFGMKCGLNWKGKSVNLATKEEYKKGSLTTIRDNFRVYSNLQEGIRGYCEFIISFSRYKNLIGIADNALYIRTIKADGWATDSAYVKTLTNILNSYVLPLCNSSDRFYPAYTGYSISIVYALHSMGIDASMANRKKIAKANNITGYRGTAAQNQKLLKLLKEGKLIKA